MEITKSKTRYIYFIALLIISGAVFSSCGDDESQAEESLIGNWEVTDIRTIYGEFSQNGIDPTETIEETGQLGIFNFTSDSVDYNFMVRDSLITGHTTWTLDLAKVNSGFTKVNDFTLTVGNQYQFTVEFGDQTSNAEKNAVEMRFIQIVDENSESMHIMNLMK